MPKMKTHKTTAKRFHVTGTGKIMRLKGHRSHLRRRKAKRVQRLYDRKLEVETRGEKARIKRLMPYSK
ncbi:MAG: 50S ribosomal protein L35 [Chloroflexi bacterium]|nr:50S ribosomal protein L35 [Chloroflexota bacterium]